MKARLPALAAILVLLAHVYALFRAITRHTGGAFCYPIDDPFIHLAMARRIAFDGIYGVSHEFASASSSIVWPWLLAACARVFGDHTTTPFILNIVFAVLLVLAVDWVMKTAAPKSPLCLRGAVALAVVVFTPLPTLVVIGMEHTLHALLTILFVAEASRVLTTEDARPRRLLVLALMLTSVRFEGLFLVGFVTLLALARRRFRLGGSVLLAGGLPVVLFGLYAKAHGGLFLPTSVVLKGRHFKFEHASDVGDLLGGDLLHKLGTEGHLLSVTLVALVLALVGIRKDGLFTRRNVALVLCVATTLAHVELASLGWFFRYEAYLVALSLTFIGVALADLMPEPGTLFATMRRAPLVSACAAVLTVVAIAPLARRAIEAANVTPLACRNVYEQQVQSARFLARYFGKERVAINDIGAVAYYGEEPMVDLVGLASLSVAKAKGYRIEQPLTRAQIVELTADVTVAIVYDEWFPDALPPTWLRVGRWQIDDNKSAANAAVSIYATTDESVPRVITALRAFARDLPKGVHQEGRYTEGLDDGAAAEPKIGAGTTLMVAVEGSPEISSVYTVKPDGWLYPVKLLPLNVRGKTASEASALVREAVQKDPKLGDVHVRILEGGGTHLYVAGKVQKSGELRGAAGEAFTVGRAINLAGGLAPGASAAAMGVWREHAGVFERVPVVAMDVPLENYDIVVVP